MAADGNPLDDTSPDTRRRMLEIWRSMTAAQRAEKAESLNRAVDAVARAGIRAQHPKASDREVELRLAARHIPSPIMRAAFDWDPAIDGS